MIKKKSQIIGMDLVLGVTMYLIALSIFFILIKNIPVINIEKKLEINADFILNNIENIPTSQCSNCDFLDGSKFYSNVFDNSFLSKTYEDKKRWVLGDITTLGFNNVDFCIYIIDNYGNIVRHTGSDSIKLSSGQDCLINEKVTINSNNANPQCETGRTTQAVVLSKPILYLSDVSSTSPQITNLNILVCANDE